MIRLCWIQAAVFVLATLSHSKIGGSFTGSTSFAAIDNVLKKNYTFNATRIVGGTWAKRGAYPYQAALFLNGEFNCGGTLLPTRLHVLTAAHCLSPLIDPQTMTIYFRTTVLNPLDSNHIERKANNFSIHPDYNATSFKNDIGVITLSESVAEIRPVKLEPITSLDTSYAGREATVVGWGRTRQVLYPAVSSGEPSNNLKHVNVTVIDDHDCSVLYHDDSLLNDPKRLCTSTLFGKSICQGDSGGPLIIDDYQIGINSAAAGCADPRYPAIFIRASSYMDWIKSSIESSGPFFKPA